MSGSGFESDGWPPTVQYPPLSKDMQIGQLTTLNCPVVVNVNVNGCLLHCVSPTQCLLHLSSRMESTSTPHSNRIKMLNKKSDFKSAIACYLVIKFNFCVVWFFLIKFSYSVQLLILLFFIEKDRDVITFQQILNICNINVPANVY